MKILMVCLGNICRSPMAEGIMRHKAAERGIAIELDSCGTSSYHLGEPPDDRAVANASKNGVDITDLRARQFQPADFERFERIYVMDQSNFNDVLEQATEEQQKGRVKMILNALEPGANRPVPDPYFGGEEGFQEVFDLLDAACDTILDELEK